MKRHEALIPLSHDHHEALLVALRLKKGGPASVRDPWPEDPAAQRDALFLFVSRDLYPHFSLEEELLFPACKSASEPLRTLAAELAQEHQAMRGQLEDIRTTSKALLQGKLQAFGLTLEAHIRKEERSFFPLVQEQLEAKTLAVDLDKLAAQYAACHQPPACDV
jgi:iron-sulfur cluster repair protein YtfE (RIC family)